MPSPTDRPAGPAGYRLVLFDFDGTLADTFPLFLRVMNAAAARYRFLAVDERELPALRRAGSREVMRRLRVAPWKLPLIARYYRREAARGADAVRLFPGVDAVLRDAAAAGVRLALVTSNTEPTARRVLGPELAGLFEAWECGAALFGKAARFRRVLRASGVAPAEALAVGDDVRDLDAARAAGVPFGAVSWGYAAAEALRAGGPAALFERVEDLRAAILGGPALR